MPAGGQQYPSLAALANKDPQAYRDMPVDQRLAMLQGPYFGDRASMSPEDLQLFKLLSARNRREQSQQGENLPQIAPGGQAPGILGRLFQFFSGREASDPLEALKQPGYAGRPSR